jgi:rod shape-determining protein MreC
MPQRNDRNALVMALTLVGVTGLAVVDRVAAPIEDSVERLLTPFQSILDAGAGRLDAMASRNRDVETLLARVEELEDENYRQEVAVLTNNDLARENESLRKLLHFANQRVDLDLRGASVVGRKVAEEPGNLVHTIKVDIGERHGADVGMPVASDRGLIGRVMRAGTTWSDVLLITDPSSAVEGRVERSRETGVVFGSTSGELRMRFIPQDLGGEPNVAQGDMIFTSGLSETFPEMIPIGQVVRVEQSDVQTHQEAVIRPTVDFTTLEFVLVITGPAATASQLGP